MIPSSPVVEVLRRLEGEWVSLEEYAQRVEAGVDTNAGAGDTIRIVLADWFLAELGHDKRRPVLIDFCVWRQLRPLARRLYAMLQATSRAEHDPERLYVWFAPVARTDGRRVGGSRRLRWGLRRRGWTRSPPGSGQRSRSCARWILAMTATGARRRMPTPSFRRSPCG